MGKRNYGDGIIDRRWNPDGSPSRYKGKLPYRADVNHPGWRKAQCFPELKEARDWKAEEEEDYRNRKHPGYARRREMERLRPFKVRQLVYEAFDLMCKDRKRHADVLDNTPSVISPDSLRIHRFFTNASVGFMSVLDAKKHHFDRYFNEELQTRAFKREGWKKAKTITANAAARERNIIQRCYQVAIDKDLWGLCHLLENPVKGITIHRGPARTRTLLPGEEEKLMEVFEARYGLNKHNLPLAMYLALDTAMRPEEVVGLKWTDVNFETRRISIRKNKTDWLQTRKGFTPGRTIVLPYNSMCYLIELAHKLHKESKLDPHERTFKIPNLKSPIDYPDQNIFINRYGKPWSAGALGDAFGDSVKLAKLPPNEAGEVPIFHDLRRTANEDFIRAGLHEDQRNVMRGKAMNGIDATYQTAEREAMLEKIQPLLDRYALRGKRKDKEWQTLEEAWFDTEGKKPSVETMLDRGYVIAAPIMDRMAIAGVAAFFGANASDEAIQIRKRWKTPLE